MEHVERATLMDMSHSKSKGNNVEANFARTDFACSKVKSEEGVASSIDCGYLEYPNSHDILLGRGKPFQNHTGNQTMLKITDLFRKRYHESDRAFKHEIIEEVIEIIKRGGGRFLRQVYCAGVPYWTEVPQCIAYRKVGHAFRSNARQITMKKRSLSCLQSTDPSIVMTWKPTSRSPIPPSQNNDIGPKLALGSLKPEVSPSTMIADKTARVKQANDMWWVKRQHSRNAAIIFILEKRCLELSQSQQQLLMIEQYLRSRNL